VQLDRRVKIPAADLAEQLKLALAIRDDFSRIAGIVERLRAVKRQLATRAELLKDDKAAEPLVKEGKALVAKLDALEEKLHNPKAEVVYDILAQKGGAKLYSQLGAMYDWITDSDGAPTQGMRDLYAEHARELRGLEAEWHSLLDQELPRLSELARMLNVPAVIVPETGKASRQP
jgi:hypothetical protein